PAKRYESAGAFEAALAGFLAPAPPVPDPIWRKTLIFVGAVFVVALAVGGAYLAIGRPGPVDIPGTQNAAAPTPTSPAGQHSYRIETALYKQNDGQGIRLRYGAHVAPGAEIFAEIHASVPTYVYVVNEDEQGETYLLFPLPGHTIGNPLPADTVTRLPGVQ